MGEEQDMDLLIANARQIFVTMPAKSGGTSMKRFTEKCMKNKITDNILNVKETGFRWKKLLMNSLPQPIISSHLYTDDNFNYLVNSANQDTLIIYSHREEGSRLTSAVKFVATERLCRGKGNGTHCILDELVLINTIAAQDNEIGFSTHRLLTCQLYEAIHESAPKLVFLHYKQLDKLQRLLAKHHCPELSNELPVKKNVAGDKALKVLIAQNGVENFVDIDEWLHTKSHSLEWTLELKTNASCQGKTIHMEYELFSCPDEALRITFESIDRW